MYSRSAIQENIRHPPQQRSCLAFRVLFSAAPYEYHVTWFGTRGIRLNAAGIRTTSCAGEAGAVTASALGWIRTSNQSHSKSDAGMRSLTIVRTPGIV